MLNLLSTLVAFAAGEGLVWGALGLASVGVCAVCLRALAARAQGTLTRHRHRAAYQALYQQLRNTSVDVEIVLYDFPHSPVGAFLRWRVQHCPAPATVEAKIASLVAAAEGNSPRLLDVAKVTSPLLGLAGTLLGLQQAFGQAHLGKAAVEAGLAQPCMSHTPVCSSPLPRFAPCASWWIPSWNAWRPSCGRRSLPSLQRCTGAYRVPRV